MSAMPGQVRLESAFEFIILSYGVLRTVVFLMKLYICQSFKLFAVLRELINLIREGVGLRCLQEEH
jgi:hypothetical protein